MSTIVWDILFSTIFIFLSITGYIYIQNLSFNSKIFPQLISVILFTLSTIYFVTSLVKLIKKIKYDKISFAEVFPKNIDITIIVILGYTIIMNYIGFLISSIVFFNLLALYLQSINEKEVKLLNIIKTVIYSSLIVFVFYFIFQEILLVPLPSLGF